MPASVQGRATATAIRFPAKFRFAGERSTDPSGKSFWIPIAMGARAITDQARALRLAPTSDWRRLPDRGGRGW
jgi:hypothetical protein